MGWLQQMEATGYKFYNANGVQQDCLQILKDNGINTIRLRVFVNPSADRISGHCSKNEVAGVAVRAKNLGLRVMIDFHYSDSWADPGKQTKPAAWANHSFSQLLNDVYNHTVDVLNTLKSRGVTPEWVQIGNEIPRGLLWPEGSTSNWRQLAQLLNKGYDAVKAVNSAIKVVVHLDQGNNSGRFRTFFDNFRNNGGKWDVIGMSYYPYWLHTDYTATINSLGANMNDMVARYGKDVMVVEVGGDYTKVQNTYDMLVAVQEKVKAVPNGRGLGVIYWEPQGDASWSGYQLSCWNSNGRPTAALTAFNYDQTTTGIVSGGVYRLISQYSGKAMDNGSSALNGPTVIQWTDEAGSAKDWTITNMGGGYYKLISRQSGKALDNGSVDDDGAFMMQWTDNGGDPQRWQIISTGGGRYKLISKRSGKALDNGSSTANGAEVMQWIDNGQASQRWQLVRQ